MSHEATPAWAYGVFLAAVVVHLAVLYVPQAPSTPSSLPADKLVHAGIFAAVILTGWWIRLPFRAIIVITLIHAPVSEWIQGSLLPHRSPSLVDVIADLAGIAVGALVIKWVIRKPGAYDEHV